MPLFEYDCRACEARFEARVSGARARPVCPRCGARRAARLPVAPAVHATSPAAPLLGRRPPVHAGCGHVEHRGSERSPAAGRRR